MNYADIPYILWVSKHDIIIEVTPAVINTEAN